MTRLDLATSSSEQGPDGKRIRSLSDHGHQNLRTSVHPSDDCAKPGRSKRVLTDGDQLTIRRRSNSVTMTIPFRSTPLPHEIESPICEWPRPRLL